MWGAAIFKKARRLSLRQGQAIIRRAGQVNRLSFAVVAALSASSAAADIVAAKFDDPTTRYAHGVLGDAIEWGTLEITLKTGKRLRLVLPKDRVFEDLEPRLADMDRDGDFEVVVVESSQSGGARLSIYDEGGLVTATPHIGRTNRWLAPIGAADLDGDGHMEVAYIDRPHLAKTLRVWRFDEGQLVEVGAEGGLTNHRIGEDFISGGLRDCGQGPELITADAQWRNVVSSTFSNGQIASRNIGPFKGQASFSAAMACSPIN